MSDIDVRIASTPSEYAEAFRIAYEVYFARGFTSYSPNGMRATAYQMQSNAVVLIAFSSGRPLATLSLYEGHGTDLPSASGWPMEMGEIQDRGVRACELGALMVRPDGPNSGNARACLEMFRVAWRYARRLRGASTLLAFVQAHHQAFYEKILGFSQFGPAQDYSWNGLSISAVTPLMLDLDRAESDYRERFSRFGATSRNLYWFFVEDDRINVDARLSQDLARRAGLDFAAFRHGFSHILPQQGQGTRPIHRRTNMSGPGSRRWQAPV